MTRTPWLALLIAVPLVAPAGRASAQPEARGTGTFAVQVVPAAAVYVDGRLLSADAGEHRIELPAGPHRVRVVHPDYRDLVRTIDIAPGAVWRLDLRLADKGVRKRPGRAWVSGATDAELVRGIQFVLEGDFVPAVETLEAVVRNLANVPRLMRERALGYLCLGIAYAELEQLGAARTAMARAQQIDASVAPAATAFSPQIVSLWEEARTVDTGDVDAPAPTTPTAPVEPAPEIPTPDVDVDAPRVEPSTPADPVAFIVDTESGTDLRVVSKGESPCHGSLLVEREARVVSWQPVLPTCSAPFRVPFAELRSPAAGPYGGILLQFRSDRPAITFVPQPDADLLDPQVEPMALNDLPAAARVNLRQAIRRLSAAIGRPVRDTIFGLQVDLPLDELLATPADFEGASVRTRGVFSVDHGRYMLTAGDAVVQLLPSTMTGPILTAKASEWRGLELQVGGTFSRLLNRDRNRRGESATAFVVSVAAIEPMAEIKHTGPASQTTIQAVTTTPPPGGALIRVIGRYRGRNWFGDLPTDSRRNAQDWVIKDGLFALWVTGKRPEGSGFSLGSSALRDSQAWLVVTGTIEERKGIVYLKAQRVELSSTPGSTEPVTTQTRSTLPTTAPDIAFLAPIAGVESAAPDQQFLLRFTKPMDESTFRSRVVVRYADAPQSAMARTSVTYYAERTFSIMVDPGEALQPGRTIEVVLLPGIKDVDGLPLKSGDEPRVLQWTVSAGL